MLPYTQVENDITFLKRENAALWKRIGKLRRSLAKHMNKARTLHLRLRRIEYAQQFRSDREIAVAAILYLNDPCDVRMKILQRAVAGAIKRAGKKREETT